VADLEHVELLQQSVAAWNEWRRSHPRVRPDLSGAAVTEFERDLRAVEMAVVQDVAPGRAPSTGGPWDRANLTQVDLSGADLTRARFDGAILIEADLSRSDLTNASLSGCVLTGANLSGARASGIDLTAATLRWANLSDADLDRAVLRLANLDHVLAPNAILRDADLFHASVVGADLAGANLSHALVYGLSAWDVDVTDAVQTDLVITKAGDPPVTVDDLDVAQFLYFLIENRHVRSMIETITTKLVLILGRFTPQRRRVLEAIRALLRDRGYVPILFDFERPASRDLTETVVTLAHMARFVVADITEPASVPKELEAIVPTLAVPIAPLLHARSQAYAMFSDYWKYDWVLEITRYRGLADLRRSFDARVIQPAEKKAKELVARRNSAV
jgi:uncharacterized protein YjbI with pentapeptide repeats